MKMIKSFKLSVTWSDGEMEGLASDLPEHIHESLMEYFQELEELRQEHDADMREEAYSFAKDEPKELVKCQVSMKLR